MHLFLHIQFVNSFSSCFNFCEVRYEKLAPVGAWGSLVPRPSYHGVPVRGPGNNGLRMRLIKTARYA